MFKKWVTDIRVKTREMDRGAKAEYVMDYYWYHILLGLLAVGLLILGIYHMAWGRKKADFSLAVVNQDINHERDQKVCDGFAAFSGIEAKNMQVDSDFLISYGDTEPGRVDETSYDKFFFSWSAGAIDGAIMPESFYRYCRKLDGAFVGLEDLQAGETAKGSQGELFFKDGGKPVGVYIDRTCLREYFHRNTQDPYVLVFPGTMKHKETAGKFLEYALQGM